MKKEYLPLLLCVIVIMFFIWVHTNSPYKSIIRESTDGDLFIIQFDTKAEWLEYVSLGDTLIFWIPAKDINR